MRLTLLALLLSGCMHTAISNGSDGPPEPTDGGPRVDAAGRSCGMLSDDVQRWIDDHATCARDTDCIATSTPCGLPGVCGAFLSAQSLNGLQDLVGAWTGQKCMAVGGCPRCAAPELAVCEAGRCVGGPSCDPLRDRVQRYIDEHLACQSDGDCESIVTDCGLPGVCGAGLRADAVSGLNDLVDQWRSRKCFENQACPDCAPQLKPTCKLGLCAAF